MKRLLAVLLATLLLTGCGAKKTPPPESAETPPDPPPPPPATAAEVITYGVTDRTEAWSEEAEDGTTLIRFYFQLPQLQVLLNGERLEGAASEAQRQALNRAAAFNNEFDRWLAESDFAEAVSMARTHYEADPDFFSGMYYTEELTSAAYQKGGVVSVFGTCVSFLGGAHGNTSFLSWNFDLDSGAFFHIPELARDPQGFTLFVADAIEAQASGLVAELLPDGGPFTLADIYWPDYREIMERWSDGAASLTGEGLQILFAPYDLAPYAAGPQEFLIPYEELEPYWSDSGRALLGLNA